MALGVAKLTWSQRKRLHRLVIAAITLNALISLALILLGTTVPFSLGQFLPRPYGGALNWIFSTIALYGCCAHLYSLVGIKLCHNYFHGAERSKMNFKLFLWMIMGFFMICIGAFMSSLCSSTAIHLPEQIHRSLSEGMKRYLTDIAWKHTLDHMQTRMRCCGIDSYDDWYKTYWIQRELLNLDSPNILEYAEVDGRVTPAVLPWSCCRSDVKGPCYHDPLQLSNPENDSTFESLNTLGCLSAIRITIQGPLYSTAGLVTVLLVSQAGVTVLSRLDFTAARNAVALGNRQGSSTGWLLGRLDFGNVTGPNLCQIDRVSASAVSVGSDESITDDSIPLITKDVID